MQSEHNEDQKCGQQFRPHEGGHWTTLERYIIKVLSNNFEPDKCIQILDGFENSTATIVI